MNINDLTNVLELLEDDGTELRITRVRGDAGEPLFRAALHDTGDGDAVIAERCEPVLDDALRALEAAAAVS